MRFQRPTERAKFFYAGEYNNLELLHATFVTHRFVPHFHETYVVGVIERGDYTFLCRGVYRRRNSTETWDCGARLVSGFFSCLLLQWDCS